MKKIAFITLLGTLPAVLMAQTAVDAYNLCPNDMRGTARYMSMAGAFGALGGDLSSLQVNPAGIGVYRGSEIGLTLDIDMANSTTNAGAGSQTVDKTHFFVNNFGYIGTARFSSEATPTFSWGVSYNRLASFDRTYSGYVGSLDMSMSDYIAQMTDGYSPDDLDDQNMSYNPYFDSYAPWLGIMAYNSCLINPSANGLYNGLWTPGVTTGDAAFHTRERGYSDEYSINFGGNVYNTLYWGVGLGITDINMTSDTYYEENLANADVLDTESNPNKITPGDAWYSLRTHSNTSGSGFNLKLGAILKPINELRIGVAFHTPTWYNLSTSLYGQMDYEYNYHNGARPLEGYADSEDDYYDWHMRSPWKFVGSVAGVIGGRFILSGDYEYKAFDGMRVSLQDRFGEFTTDNEITKDVKACYKPVNTLRIGAEYRVTPKFSVRAGYSTSSTSVKSQANNGDVYIWTSGCNPAYTMNKGTDYITCGLGYRTGGFYIDAAYVHKKTESTWHGFSSFDYNGQGIVDGPMSSLKTTNNNIVLSVGYKF